MDSDPSSDEETEKSTNAFKLMMQPPKKAKVEEVDPIVIAVIYIRWLKWIDPSEPLYGLPYVGQAVRAKETAEEVAVMRWKEENMQAVREDKDIGLIHCLDVYGPAAFDDQIVESKRGPRSEVQKYADEREMALIAEHGGPLRDSSVRCKQTLNQDHGGKFGMNFESRDALRTRKWLKFKAELESYVECYETSLVPRAYVNPVSKYKLGERLACVRQGHLWKVHPDEAARVAWLQALPRWAWNARYADDFKEECSERCKKRFESQEARGELSKRAKAQVAREAADGKKTIADRGKGTRTENWTKEQREEVLAKQNATSAAKRAKVLEGLPPLARKMKEKKYTRTDRAEASRKGRGIALLQLPAYSDKGFQWCYRNLAQAEKDGAIFSKNDSGVWSARVFERAGSSAEHGAHV